MDCYSGYSEEGHGRAVAPPSPLLTVSTVTAHPLTVSVPITVLLYDGPLLCGFNVAIKGLIIIATMIKIAQQFIRCHNKSHCKDTMQCLLLIQYVIVRVCDKLAPI